MANLLETATQAGNFTKLVWAINTAGLGETLASPGPMTVLAPTDEAFEKLPSEALESLSQDIPKLKRVLMYHVLPGDARLEDLCEIDEAPTAEGSVVAVSHTNGQVQVNDANVVKTDILTDNGVIHAIDTVLMPAIIAGH